jgi:long-chain acyl-CoA synthetase
MNSQPWLNHYDREVPAHISYPDIPLHQVFFDAAERYPDHVCLCSGEDEITYSEVRDKILAFAGSLIQLGIQPGQRIGLILPNIQEFVISYYAVLSIGAVVVPLNPTYTRQELEAQIRQTQIRLVIGHSRQCETLRQLKQNCQLMGLIYCCENAAGNESDSEQNYFDYEYAFHDLLREGITSLLPTVDKNAPALFQFSGGTTGIPKAAVVLHHNIVANVVQFRQWLTTLEDGREQFLTVIPLSHVYGMVIGLNVGISMGATINLISDPRDIKKILDTIQRRQISFYPGVPTMYHAINQNEFVRSGKYDLRSIKACISGSAPLMPEVRRQFQKLTGGKLVEGYGLSEAPTATHCNPIRGENRNGSIGLPLPDVDCRIQSDKEGGDSGELLIRGPQVMAGYHEDEAATRQTIVDGWLHTGDIARMDGDGYFYVIGRQKELIKVGGLQVWPQEVEAALLKNGDVKEAVVAGIPDTGRGEQVKAWVVLREGSKADAEVLRKACASEIAYFKVPHEIEFIKEIPRTSVGKILRRELVKREIEKKDRE